MNKTALITGATGSVGSALVHALAEAGIRPRAFVRDPDKAGAMLGDHADLVVGDLADSAALREAMADVDALFLACGNVPDQVVLERGAIDAARSVRVGRVVKLSARGAASDAAAAYWRGHAAIEEHLTASGLASVVLRPSFYMSNLLAAAGTVRAHGLLPAAAGIAPIAMIDPVDVAAVAARALIDDTIATGTLTLSGPEALTYDEVARHLSDVAGRDVTYLDVPPEAAAEAMVANGVPELTATRVLEVFASLRQGDDARTSDVVPRLTGRAATTVADFARRHAPAFADLVSR